MRDLNFFEPYIDKRQLKITVPIILLTFIALYAIYTMVFGIFNQSQIKVLANDVENLRSIAENPKTVEKITEIKELEAEVITFEEEVNKIKEMDKVVEASHIIDEDYLALVTSKMPENLFFTNFSVNNSEIQITGISKDKWAVAEFSKGLSDIDNVDEIFVSNITGQEDYYNFSMMVILKGVRIYDENIF